MSSDFGKWTASVDDDMDIAHGCCIEACQQMATINSQVTDLAGTSVTSDEKQNRKEDFEKKFRFLEERCEQHLPVLPDSMREAHEKEMAGARKTFETVIRFLD
ncbi:unnamed protein product [Clonostachys chloroleuca]|uniref:Uncharacterized protein n=1 Tax=Clonostachys chloroleuca TaxID=1926264 RepID=A0AA35LUP7_9HYPO|nr:unnamed protein product [Clonostachys chloroleuca]